MLHMHLKYTSILKFKSLQVFQHWFASTKMSPKQRAITDFFGKQLSYKAMSSVKRARTSPSSSSSPEKKRFLFYLTICAIIIIMHLSGRIQTLPAQTQLSWALLRRPPQGPINKLISRSHRHWRRWKSLSRMTGQTPSCRRSSQHLSNPNGVLFLNRNSKRITWRAFASFWNSNSPRSLFIQKHCLIVFRAPLCSRHAISSLTRSIWRHSMKFGLFCLVNQFSFYNQLFSRPRSLP